MIRREIQLADQPPGWLLISQMEHARVSRALAEHCLPAYPETFRSELLEAVQHHDDGWSTFDAGFVIDRDQDRPYSFRELPLELSLPIWKRSIDVCADLGPLAGWLVSGHFLALLDNSESPDNELTVHWREEQTSRRAKWIRAWMTQQPAQNTQSIADEGLGWLQLLDMKSLWLCSVCAGVSEAVEPTRERYLFAEQQSLETLCKFDEGRASFSPWRFDVSELEIEANGWFAPHRKYRDETTLHDASIPHAIRWRIVQSD